MLNFRSDGSSGFFKILQDSLGALRDHCASRDYERFWRIWTLLTGLGNWKRSRKEIEKSFRILSRFSCECIEILSRNTAWFRNSWRFRNISRKIGAWRDTMENLYTAQMLDEDSKAETISVSIPSQWRVKNKSQSLRILKNLKRI